MLGYGCSEGIEGLRHLSGDGVVRSGVARVVMLSDFGIPDEGWLLFVEFCVLFG
jgi:hypothetical protein